MCCRQGKMWQVNVYLGQLVTKPTKWHVRPAKTRINLGIRPVWSESSLCAQWVAKDTKFLDSEDSDQPGRIPRLIWVFARRIWHFVGFVMRLLKTCVTSKDSDQLVNLPSMARILMYPSWGSPESLEGPYDRRRLWSDCSDVQDDLSPCWSQKSYCRFCHAFARLLFKIRCFSLHATFLAKQLSPFYSDDQCE